MREIGETIDGAEAWLVVERSGASVKHAKIRGEGAADAYL